MNQIITITKYLAVASCWAMVAFVASIDKNTVVYTTLIGLVATGIILHTNDK